MNTRQNFQNIFLHFQLLVILFILSFVSCSTDNNKLFDKPAPSRLELFAPGFISTGLNEGRIVFSPDMDEFFMGTTVRRNPYTIEAVIVTSKKIDVGWTEIKVAEFSGMYSDMAPCYHPNGERLVFQSDRPTNNENFTDQFNFWYLDKVDGKWSEPKLFENSINGNGNVYGASIAANGNMYFTRELVDGSQKIFCSKFIDGKYLEPYELPESVNSVRSQFDGFVSPDESYMILPVYGRDDSYGSTDYYITFKNDQNEWSDLKNLGENFNTKFVDGLVSISADGKSVFFSSKGFNKEAQRKLLTYSDLINYHNSPAHGSYDVYWVATEAIMEFRGN